MAKALRSNRVLERLCLQGNNAGDDGAVAFATYALQDNPDSALHSLHFGDNQIEVRGGSALARAFPGNTCITMMDLDGNNVSDADKRVIFSACSSNKFGF